MVPDLESAQLSVPNVLEYYPLIIVTAYTSNMATMGAPSFMGFISGYFIGYVHAPGRTVAMMTYLILRRYNRAPPFRVPQSVADRLMMLFLDRLFIAQYIGSHVRP